MTRYITFAAVVIALVAAGGMVVTPALARGGGAANITGSPGYQRALQESRQRYRDSTSPYTKPPGAYPRKTWRHRGKR